MLEISQTKLLADPAGGTQIDFIAHSPLFDRAWYVAENQSVLLSGLDPAEHYYRIGAHLGWNPGPDFDTLGYLATHSDVREAGMNPLAHFEKYGRRKGRKIPAPGMPRIAPAQAVSASVVSERDWRMTRQEAERILCASLAPLAPDTQPQRLLQSFNPLAARRYAAAAAALYGDNCAALKATVIMPTYDRSAKLMKAVQSVLDQSHSNFELLVVDDAFLDRYGLVSDAATAVAPETAGESAEQKLIAELRRDVDRYKNRILSLER